MGRAAGLGFSSVLQQATKKNWALGLPLSSRSIMVPAVAWYLRGLPLMVSSWSVVIRWSGPEVELGCGTGGRLGLRECSHRDQKAVDDAKPAVAEIG